MDPRNSMHFRYWAMLLEQGTTTQVIRKQKTGAEWVSKQSDDFRCLDGPSACSMEWKQNILTSTGTRLKYTYSSTRNSKDTVIHSNETLSPHRSPTPEPTGLSLKSSFTCSLGQFDLKKCPPIPDTAPTVSANRLPQALPSLYPTPPEEPYPHNPYDRK